MKRIIFVFILLPMFTFAAERDVQITTVNFDASVVTVTNLGEVTENLDGWRFCSHNTTFIRRYSGLSGLNGVSLAAGESLFIHYNNDAVEANEINVSSLGGVLASLERDAYGLQLYFAPVSFINGNTIADHLQWSVNGIDNATADERSDEAELGGVWIDQSEWIPIENDSELINLTDLSGAVLHSPANYIAGDLPVSVPVLPAAFLSGLFAILVGLVMFVRHRV